MARHILLVEDRALAQVHFGVIPHLLIWIELRGLGRQESQENFAVLLPDEALGLLAVVIAGDVGDHQDGFAERVSAPRARSAEDRKSRCQ
jgi:hypothetical protein